MLFKKTNLSFIVFFFLLIVSFVEGAYYADVKIELNDDGSATITGDTNHPSLVKYSTMSYTTKKENTYTFNITLQEVFSSYIYEIKFPKGAKINYLKTPRLARIDDDSGIIKVIGTGSNQPFLIIAQYTLSEKRNTLFFVIGLVSLLLFILVIFFILSRKARSKYKGKSYNPDALTQRQKQIISILEKNKGRITQAEIEKITKLPKSTLSRNIDSLIRRGIIKKEQKGMTNLISFAEK